MKIDINHPSFVNFIENVISNITTNVHVDKYFSLSKEQKLGEQLKVFKIMNNSLRSGIKLNEPEYKSFKPYCGREVKKMKNMNYLQF